MDYEIVTNVKLSCSGYTHPIEDKKEGKTETQNKFSENINNLMTKFDLTDKWQIRNPQKFLFTTREACMYRYSIYNSTYILKACKFVGP